MKRKILQFAFAFAGALIGARLGNLLDAVFTDLGTVSVVGILFGAWTGAMIGGGGLALCCRQIQRDSLSRNKATALVAFCAIGAALAVPSLTDSSNVPPGVMLGVVFALYRFTRTDCYRYVFAALLLGTFVGTAISVAGGFEPIAKAIQTAQVHGVQHFVDSAKEGDFHHSYWGRDREEFLIASALVGLALGATASLMAAFVASLLSLFWQRFTALSNDELLKPKQKQKRP